jgi:hypothetical protein
MKITPLLTSLLFALSLTGAAQAKVNAAPVAPIAPATIDAEKCVPNAASSCMTADDTAARDGDSVDLATLPKAGPVQVDAAASAVPEPQTFAMMALGLALLGFSSRRRQPSDKFKN